MSHRPIRRALQSAAVCVVFYVLPSFAQYAPNRYAVFLADPPLAQRFQAREQLRSPAAAAYRQSLAARHTEVVRELQSRNIEVVGQTSTLLNAIFVVVPASRVAELESISGVAGVRPMRRGKRQLNRATQLLNAPAAWNLLGGEANAGQGMKIAILDTGIDQTHPAFQDSLPMPAGFPICTSGHKEDCAYTSNKVIVARSYVRQIAAGTNASNRAADSKPDDYSPRDRDGHGTAVASCAAADENTGTVTFTGMAPKAYLGNYKIYGSDGVNDYPPEDVWIQAIEDALNDGMDVANLSSGLPALSGALDKGSACGIAAGVPCDPLATAFENAV
ncbi:MAG: S8 family serine peptidase, partial [bacterium]